ncbi:glycosyltransferase [uncultured Microbacterium sp.]|uniref:glycosyltransferase n=1 Tax=uncultured Microbacterium sp. TaxID=191216 RepID=UPI0025EEB7D5|nr:glycosyltransferase [uncultured Microbacterium sp.]
MESFGGGVSDAVNSFRIATPEHEHHLLYALRPGVDVPPGIFDGFASAVPLPAGHSARVRATRRRVRELQPDLVHAHSSFAGVYTRLAVSRRTVPIVYSPHCLSFERRDLSPAMRGVYQAIERLLVPNTTSFAACSEREALLARALAPGRPVRVVANIPRPGLDGSARAEPPGDATVVMIGRLAPQKGIAAFARLARELRERGVPARAVWVGGGEEHLAAPLLDAGVEVTGWISPDAVAEHLSRASLYVHTAEWEGFPIGLLEALASGVPSLLVDRPYADELPRELVVSDDELAARVEVLIGDPGAREALRAVGAHALAQHTPSRQQEDLRRIYREALTPASVPAADSV